jgi:hypothetical protein
MSELTIPLQQYARTAAQLATENPILLDKQLVIERDTGKMKLGNGTTAFNSLPYLLFSGTSSQFVRGDGSLATFPSIPSIAGLVPYTGATANVNLGTNTITANQLIKSGGTASQFLKADGSIDSTVYYPNSNPSGFITNAALNPYLLSSTAASTYYPLTNPSGFITSAALSGYVPYTGATANVNLGTNTITTGADATINGVRVGRGSGNSFSSTAIGLFALNNNTDGSFNTALGAGVLINNTQGSQLTAIGHSAGDSNTTGDNNIFIGYNSVGVSATESNRTWIGNGSTTSTWLGGNLLLGTTTNNGVDRLQVNGSARISGTLRAAQISTTKQTLTPTGTTQTIDWNNGSIVDLLLSSATGNVTLTLLNAQNAICPLIEVTNGATPRNLIFPTGTLQSNGGGNVYVGTANQKDVIAVLWDGTQYLISISKNYS